MFSDSSKGEAARPARSRRPLAWLSPFGVMVLFGLMAGLGGCGGCSTTPTTTTTGGPRPDPIARDLLNPAITMMQPDHLGLSSVAARPASLLNQWRAVRMKTEGKDRLSEPLPEETRTLLETRLSADAAKRAARDEFQEQDVAFIRTSMLMKQIVDHVAQGVDGELNRAQVVFDYVCRNIQLVSEENALSLTPYEMLIFGEGTAADRAWIFAELLRQLNQDAVIVAPHSADASEDAPWFVGAVAKGRIHLFDPLRSTPVPSKSPVKIEEIVPATIEDLSHPKVLETLTAGTDKTLSPEMFEKVRLELIGSSLLWSSRMLNLQDVLSGEDSVVISQQLTADSGDSSSILNRLASLDSSRWSLDELRIWQHPEARLRGFEEIDSLSERWRPFEAEQTVEADPNTGQLLFGNFTKTQLKTRTLQLQGNFVDAIPGYQRIRLANARWGAHLSGEVGELHADAAEDAQFWSGVCQMELGELNEAANQFRRYVQQAERFGGSRHGGHARILLARCLNLLGETDNAIEALKPLDPQSPEYETAMFLQHAFPSAAPSAAPSQNLPPENPPKPEPAVAEKAERGT